MYVLIVEMYLNSLKNTKKAKERRMSGEGGATVCFCFFWGWGVFSEQNKNTTYSGSPGVASPPATSVASSAAPPATSAASSAAPPAADPAASPAAPPFFYVLFVF